MCKMNVKRGREKKKATEAEAKREADEAGL